MRKDTKELRKRCALASWKLLVGWPGLLMWGLLWGCAHAPSDSPAPPFWEEVRAQRQALLPLLPAAAGSREKPLAFWAQLSSGLAPLHQPLSGLPPTQWEQRFPTSPQDLAAYCKAGPHTPTQARPYLYLGKLGPFSPAQNEIFELSCLYLQAFFGCEVRLLDSIPLSEIPAEARRLQAGSLQIHTRYVLNQLLPSRMPDSAMACLLLTATDVFPSSGWKYVLGHTDVHRHTAIWSLHRLGKPEAGEAAFRLCLKRSLKTASHETGHLLSMKHCTFYRCVMQGAYDLAEADARPMYLCAVCLAKAGKACGFDPLQRFAFLQKFWATLGFEPEMKAYAQFQQQLVRILE